MALIDCSLEQVAIEVRVSRLDELNGWPIQEQCRNIATPVTVAGQQPVADLVEQLVQPLAGMREG